MCKITLSYNKEDKLAVQKLTALLSTGLFIQVGLEDDFADIDYAD